jgi:hypothetical protein
MPNMGLGYGLEKSDICIKQKHRWLFMIPNISASGVDSLPPSKASRPKMSYKEISLEHLNETIYIPGKVEMKPINLTLYDLKKNKHPVLEWFKKLYNPCSGNSIYPVDNNFFKTAYLELYDGMGSVLERWIFENVWPLEIDFGDLDMESSEVVSCDVTLRYARAYLSDEC